jgi:hypothetical protein
VTATIPRQRDRVTHRPAARYRVPLRERVLVQDLITLTMEAARVFAWAFAAVVGAGAGLMVLDWLS